jgi:hypothetical protein
MRSVTSLVSTLFEGFVRCFCTERTIQVNHVRPVSQLHSMLFLIDWPLASISAMNCRSERNAIVWDASNSATWIGVQFNYQD